VRAALYRRAPLYPGIHGRIADGSGSLGLRWQWPGRARAWPRLPWRPGRRDPHPRRPAWPLRHPGQSRTAEDHRLLPAGSAQHDAAAPFRPYEEDPYGCVARLC